MNYQSVKLGDACEVKRGNTITEKQAIAGDVPVIAGGLTYSYKHNVANRNGNVITVSGSGANAGYVNFWSKPIFASDCSTIQSLSNNVDIKYVYYFLKSKQFFINSTLRSGAAQPHVYAKDIAQLMMPLPPLVQQKRIAEILDKAAEIKAKREQAIAKLDDLAQSTFVEMFGGVNSKDYKTDHLGLGITLVGGGAFKSSDFLHEGIPLIRIGEVNRQDFDSDKLPCLPENFEKHYSRFIVKNGDLLMSLTGTTGKDDYGNVALINGLRGKYFLNQRVALIKPKEDVFITEYLMYLLKNKDIKNRLISRSRGVRQANISNGDITSLVVQFPPLAKQIEFKNAIKNISAYITSAENGLRKNELLLTSLQHQIFTEELTS